MLFCITANYAPKVLNAMRENPSTNRRDAVEQTGEGRWRQVG